MESMMDTSDGGGQLPDLEMDENPMTFQNASNTTFVHPFSDLFYRSIFIFIYSVIFTVCIVGNVLVLFVTTKSVHMKTRTYFFLANLAVADLCVGVLCVLPNLLMFLYPGWLLGQAMCKMYYFAESFSFCASIMLLAVIAVERYIAVLHPLKAKGLFTKWRMHAMQAAIWIIAAAYNAPLLVIFDTISVPKGNGTDVIEFCFIHQAINMRSYYTINFVLWYAVPLVVMLFVYVVIAWTLWHSGSTFTSTAATDSSNSSGGSGSKLFPNSQEDKLFVAASSSSSGTNSCSAFTAEERSTHTVFKGTVGTSRDVETSLRCGQSVGNKGGNNPKRKDEVSQCRCKDSAVSHNLTSFGPADIGLTGSPHTARAKTVYRNRNRILMCWSWASSYDSPKHDNNASSFTRSTSPRTRATTIPPPNYFELASINNSHNGSVHWQANPFHSVSVNQPTGGRNARQTTVNYDRSSESYRTRPLPENKPRYITTSMRVLYARRKVVRLLVVLLVAFGVCVLPHHVRLLMHYWHVYPRSTFLVSFFPPISFICLYLNSALNPVLYSLFSESFRRSLRECARKPCQRWKSLMTKPESWDSRRDRYK